MNAPCTIARSRESPRSRFHLREQAGRRRPASGRARTANARPRDSACIRSGIWHLPPAHAPPCRHSPLLFLALLGLSGCKGSCRELSEKLCDCSTNSVQRELCIRKAANDETLVGPSAEEEAVCEQRLEKCNCDALRPDQEGVTEEEINEAKVNCGLANENP